MNRIVKVNCVRKKEKTRHFQKVDSYDSERVIIKALINNGATMVKMM